MKLRRSTAPTPARMPPSTTARPMLRTLTTPTAISGSTSVIRVRRMVRRRSSTRTPDAAGGMGASRSQRAL